MQPLVYPTPDDLRIIDQDLITHEIDATGYSSIRVFYGVDANGDEWRWWVQTIYDAARDEWVEGEPFNWECVS